MGLKNIRILKDMCLNKKYKIVSIIWFLSLLSACSTDYTFEKGLRKRIRNYAEAEKLDADQLRQELQSVDYAMDSIERLRYSITDTFIVDKIYKGEGVFEIILLSREKKYYEIYSPEEKSLKRKKIKVGQAYRMTLVPYFNFKGRRRPLEIIRPVYLKGYRIIPYPIFFGQIYSVNNLEGLHFLANEL